MEHGVVMGIRYSQLCAAERNVIQQGLNKGRSQGAIARDLGRPASAVSREINRNRVGASYDAAIAGLSTIRRRRHGPVKLKWDSPLMQEVISKLRRGWSPEQIAGRLRHMHPDSPELRLSHETIYRTLYLLPRGELRKELLRMLRYSHKKRKPRAQGQDRRGRLVDMISIHARPEEVLGRAVPGHWEGDMIKGAGNKSAVGTLVERKSRFLLLAKMRDCGADAAYESFSRVMRYLPASVRKTLTYDQGKEMARHKELAKKLRIGVYFADPHSPWQRPSNENTNGLTREYLPKGTDLSVYSQAELNKIAKKLNTRPRKCLGFATPEEIFDIEINRLSKGVALQS
jgi:IS30 family transposase